MFIVLGLYPRIQTLFLPQSVPLVRYIFNPTEYDEDVNTVLDPDNHEYEYDDVLYLTRAIIMNVLIYISNGMITVHNNVKKVLVKTILVN